MELGKQIKRHRQKSQLSQEQLADRVIVSRQTISNRENDKSCPDVNSLVLLSEIFQISLDKLIKGDLEAMKDVIQKEEIEKMDAHIFELRFTHRLRQPFLNFIHIHTGCV